MAMKRRSDMLDGHITDKSGPESPKVVILRNGSPVYVNKEPLGKGSPSALSQSHIDSRSDRRSPQLHETGAKRPYHVLYGRSEWDGDIRHMIQNDHKEGFTYVRDRREHDHVSKSSDLLFAA